MLGAQRRGAEDLPAAERAERLRRYLPQPKGEDFRALAEELVARYA